MLLEHGFVSMVLWHQDMTSPHGAAAMVSRGERDVCDGSTGGLVPRRSRQAMRRTGQDAPLRGGVSTVSQGEGLCVG